MTNEERKEMYQEWEKFVLEDLKKQIGSYGALIELVYDIGTLTEYDVNEIVERLDQIESEYGIY